MAFTTPRDWTTAEFVTEAMMDTHIRDNFLAMGPHLIARKTADESLTSNTTLQNDDVLFTPSIPANEVWQIELGLLALGTPGDVKLAWTFPSGGQPYMQCVTLSVAGTTTSYQSGAFASGVAFADARLAATARYISVAGVYINGGTAGTLQLQWAQSVSDGTATTIKAQSSLWGVKLA